MNRGRAPSVPALAACVAGGLEVGGTRAGDGHALLEVATWRSYGGVRALRGVDLVPAPGRSSRARQQRRRQEHAAARGLRHAARSRAGRRRGTIEVRRRGIDAASIRPTIVRAGIVQVPEGRRVFARPDRRGEPAGRRRCPRAGGRARPRGPRRASSSCSRAWRARAQRAGLLSGGEQQMLAIGRALMPRRGCCCSTSRRSGWRRRWSSGSPRSSGASTAQGTAVVLVEQNAAMALEVADHAYVLEVGAVTLDGPAAELAAVRRGPRALPRRRRRRTAVTPPSRAAPRDGAGAPAPARPRSPT